MIKCEIKSNITGVPIASNAQRTQISKTTPTYIKAASILCDLTIGSILDYGAGRGLGAKAINADDYEPFPRDGYIPKYTDSASIPSESYSKIISSSVINVVPRDIRDNIILDIGRILKLDGYAIITTRTLSTVKTAKYKYIHPSETNAFIVGANKVTATYQKGFTSTELHTYLKEILGNGFAISSTPKLSDGSSLSGITAIIHKKVIK